MTQRGWHELESPPAWAKGWADCWHWSTSFDAGTGPITCAITLCQLWPEDLDISHMLAHFAEGLAWLELEHVSNCLREYLANSEHVGEWVSAMLDHDAGTEFEGDSLCPVCGLVPVAASGEELDSCKLCELHTWSWSGVSHAS